MKDIIKQRINILEIDVEKLREMIKIINYEILYNNLIVGELGQLQINQWCISGQYKLKEIGRLENLFNKI